MNPTPADLAAAMETVRNPPSYVESRRQSGLSMGVVNRDKYIVACELIARHVAANAGRQRVVRPLEWADRDCFASHSITVFGRIEVWNVDLGWHWRLIADDGRVIFSRRCDSLADGKAKAEAWYNERLAPALAPAFPEVEGKK